MKKTRRHLLYALLITAALWLGNARADNFIRVYATYANTEDTVGMAEQFLAFGISTPVFLPPYTLRVTVNPVSDSQYKATTRITTTIAT